MTRASYSATPLSRSLVHRPQGVIHTYTGYNQGCGAVTFLVGSGSGSGSGKNVPASAAPAPAPMLSPHMSLNQQYDFQKCPIKI